MRYCIDFDDMCDNAMTAEVMGALRELHVRYPSIKATLFAIPARCSASLIRTMKYEFKWAQLAPHGWRHSRGECLGWTQEEAKEKIEAATALGIDAPVFRAPGWLLDSDVYLACKDLNYVVASHKTFRVEVPGTREYIYNKPGIYKVRAIHGHLTPVEDNYLLDMLKDGRLDLATEATFVLPQELV